MTVVWWVLLVALAAGIAEFFSQRRAAERLSQQHRQLQNQNDDLRTLNEQLQLERDQLSALLGSGSEGLLQISRAGRIVHVNAAATMLLGLPADIRGQPVSTLIRHAELRQMLVHAAAGQPQDPIELTFDDRHLFAICRQLTDDEGAVAAIIDLTEVRRLEVVRRDFVANVSHELKTPLTSIRGYAETLIGDDLPADIRKQFLEVIQKNTMRIQRIVDDLLDLSRLQSGGWRPEIHEVNAVDLVADVWATCADTANSRSIDFRVAASHRVQVAADPGGLRQVLSNLFDNALRYTPAGGRVNVLIDEVKNGRHSEPEGDFIEIQVQDSGSGIPREALPRIFERFYRVDPARSRAEGGTGLGLSIVKHLVESMHGEVTAESELGKGTTIRIRLPAA
jgi:two-component system, OmpR family, phosphate regulon sensor histidine kinase PhoR